jgi:drug/metabolite transporter (DMT)-like permease
MRERLIAILQTITILVFMSLGTVLTKLSLEEVSPFTFTWVTVGIGVITMCIYTFVIKRERIPRDLSREVWFYILSIGFFNFVVGRMTLTFSLAYLPATTNTYLVNFIGFITMGMSIFILKESPTIFQVLGAVVALVGLRVFFVEIPPANELIGVGLIAIGITGIAYTNNIARRLAIVTQNQLSNNIISTMAIIFGGTITVALGLGFDRSPSIVGWNNWFTIIYMGVFAVAIALTVWNHILRTLRSYEASILGASTVIWTALLAIPFLGERLTLNQIGGIVLMLAGLALVQVRGGKFHQLIGRFRPVPSRVKRTK